MRIESIALPLSPIAPTMLGTTLRTRTWLVIAGVALLTASAKIQIPLWPVPMTMQTYVVLVIAMGYGFRLGLLAVGSYLALGALGFPVFAGTPAQGVGLSYMLGPTGGYLAGFVGATAVCGLLSERGWDRRLITSLLAMAIGHMVIFAFGVAWLAILVGIVRAAEVGLLPFVFGTAVKTVLAAVSLPVAWKCVRRHK